MTYKIMTIYGLLLWKRKESGNENPEFIKYIKKAVDLGNPAAITLMGLFLVFKKEVILHSIYMHWI